GHSWPSVPFFNISNGMASASVSANSTLIWGPGNINTNPQFVSLATNNYHLHTNSPCVDAGTNVLTLTWFNWRGGVTNDLEGIPRPLDGNGDGTTRFDIGAHEFLLATADSNG